MGHKYGNATQVIIVNECRATHVHMGAARTLIERSADTLSTGHIIADTVTEYTAPSLKGGRLSDQFDTVI
jgi:hypothetical protein